MSEINWCERSDHEEKECVFCAEILRGKSDEKPAVDIQSLLKKTVPLSELELKEQQIRKLRREVRTASQEALEYRTQLEAVNSFEEPVVTKIKATKKGKDATATAILVASDWHVEETVDPRVVNGMNEYNPDISKERSETFFRTGQRLIDVVARDLQVDTVVLALLGDFITNDLHEDAVEGNAMLPMEAIHYAQDLITSGIYHLLENNPKRKIVIPCHSGNHGRTTKKVHYANEKGHSLEYFMYLTLAKYFESEPRVTFNISDGYHSYIDIEGVMTRFHHGHMMKYGGGVGGITIGGNKAVAQWDKAKTADLDIFGHFHQYTDMGKWFCNGSLIGYNAFALSIKADYEPPQQGFMVIDAKRGRTWRAPIYCDESRTR